MLQRVDDFLVEHPAVYWRKAGDEVDFVVERGRTVWAVEVKSGRENKHVGLRRFHERYPECRTLVVGREGMALQAFFETPPSILFDK